MCLYFNKTEETKGWIQREPERLCVSASVGECKRGVATHNQIRQSGERMFVMTVGSVALKVLTVWRRRYHRLDRSFKSLQRKVAGVARKRGHGRREAERLVTNGKKKWGGVGGLR